MEEESEDFDEINKRLIDEDLAEMTESDSEEEEEQESADEESHEVEQDQSKSDDKNTMVRTRKKSSFDPIKNKRTVFLGNVSLSTTKKDIKKLLPPQVHIESLRFRSIPVDETKHIPRRSAVLSKQLNESIGEKNCYVVMKSEEDAQKFVDWLNEDERKNSLGGPIVKVTLAGTKDIDVKLSVFVGNLAFDTKEEDLFAHFSHCGKIKAVRIIRDKFSRQGKGFGFVTFDDSISVDAALLLNGTTLKEREIRVIQAVHPKKARKRKSAQLAKEEAEKEKKRARAKRRKERLILKIKEQQRANTFAQSGRKAPTNHKKFVGEDGKIHKYRWRKNDSSDSSSSAAPTSAEPRATKSVTEAKASYASLLTKSKRDKRAAPSKKKDQQTTTSPHTPLPSPSAQKPADSFASFFEGVKASRADKPLLLLQNEKSNHRRRLTKAEKEEKEYRALMKEQREKRKARRLKKEQKNKRK